MRFHWACVLIPILGLVSTVLGGDVPGTAEVTPPLYQFTPPALDSLPEGRVRVELIEDLSAERSWEFADKPAEPLFDTEYFAMQALPRKYDEKGLITAREAPMLLHLSGRIELPAGEYEFLLRSVDAARLYLDGELLAEIPRNRRGSGAHSPYYDGLDRGPDLLSMAEGHVEKTVKVHLDGGPHVLSLYRLFVAKRLSQRLGELIVACRPEGAEWQIFGPAQSLPFTDAGWLDFLQWERGFLSEVNEINRRRLAATDDSYWQQRHEWARQSLGTAPDVPDIADEGEAANEIDQFLLEQLHGQGIAPMPLLDDFAFLRRVSLDLLGVVPAPELITDFQSLPAATRRQQIIDRLLESPGWADHWIPYWQDVLAENPGLTKPELNNTGPFRWFLHEAFLDNKPFDRFVTELVMMEGDRYTGGPAGFGIASQNDVPMAAKAHILGTAFLGVEMKCARCHDAPYHDITQEDLFSLAAMLKRSSQQVPKSSSIPVSEEVLEQMTVKVTLSPGSKVKPNWPFAELIDATESTALAGVPDWLLRNPQDSREQLAVLLTSPTNHRFSRMAVNRLWRRYFGRGLVEPVDDWEVEQSSHPELLDWLTHELLANDYDLKHVVRLILNSNAYQRRAVPDTAESLQARQLFAGPHRRRMTAEQMTDSLFAVAGKSFDSEELTMDRDSRLSATSFGNFGFPERAWEMVSVSNERDRPSLTLPMAQSIIDLLSAFGWRQQRQEPITDREDALTPLQSLALANGTVPNRVIDLSDSSAITALAIESTTPEELTEKLFLRVLSRSPRPEELRLICQLLEDGFQDRVIAGEEVIAPRRIYRSGVCWTSHFDPRSDEEMTRRQREILQGDPSTKRLAAGWRERVEDVLWSMVNSPEFLFIP